MADSFRATSSLNDKDSRDEAEDKTEGEYCTKVLLLNGFLKPFLNKQYHITFSPQWVLVGSLKYEPPIQDYKQFSAHNPYLMTFLL